MWLRNRAGGRARRPAVIFIVAALLLSGCSRGVRLKSLPLAQGGNASLKARLTFDRNNLLEVRVEGPEPAAYGRQYTRYVAWVATPDRSSAINVGQIRLENGKGRISTLTPLRKFRFFITVEEQGDALKPGPQVVFEAPKEIEW